VSVPNGFDVWILVLDSEQVEMAACDVEWITEVVTDNVRKVLKFLGSVLEFFLCLF
jgi:hypothetical protein